MLKQIVRILTLATVCLWLSSPAFAAIQLVPVVSSGLSSPVFAGNAGDGSNRLFIVEQTGVIQVLQPGSSTPTVFLDIHTKILSGGERGLLGLAFHPLYASNRRFFVYYTRQGDGALAIAEYKASVADRDVADPTETVLLVIPHPTHANHNGGMMAFGRDGYLYIGVGDGGSGNDPPNNAQNIDMLLGKILRIDVDPVASGAFYASPPTNPFYGAIPGRDEIFARGFRNPWRFSFDRVTGQQWVGDVGQGSREEVDTPIVWGGNYGWRVYEGFACTNLDPALCNPSSFSFPVLDYAHSNGRCSVTGGYVYRGWTGALPWGTYVFADFCTGEIFAWDGNTQTLLLDTALNISSFGEDEYGELYVVNLGGTISRIAALQTPCTYSLTPTGQSFGPGTATGRVEVATRAGCDCTAVSNASWIHVPQTVDGFVNGVFARYRLDYSVDANTSPSPRSGTITIAGLTFNVEQSGAAPAKQGSRAQEAPATSLPASRGRATAK
jgi:hypothetical protein